MTQFLRFIAQFWDWFKKLPWDAILVSLSIITAMITAILKVRFVRKLALRIGIWLMDIFLAIKCPNFAALIAKLWDKLSEYDVRSTDGDEMTKIQNFMIQVVDDYEDAHEKEKIRFWTNPLKWRIRFFRFNIREIRGRFASPEKYKPEIEKAFWNAFEGWFKDALNSRPVRKFMSESERKEFEQHFRESLRSQLPEKFPDLFPSPEVPKIERPPSREQFFGFVGGRMPAQPQPSRPTRIQDRGREKFFGREVELNRTKKLMLEGQSFVIFGPMGIGKSRLIRRAAEDLANEDRYPFEIHAIVSIRKGMRLEDAVDQAIVQLRPQMPSSAEDPMLRLKAAIGNRKAIIVFENGELLADSTGLSSTIDAIEEVEGVFVLTTRRKDQAEKFFPSPENRLELGPLPLKNIKEIFREYLGKRENRMLSDKDIERLNEHVVRGVPLFAKVAASAINSWLTTKTRFDFERFMTDFKREIKDRVELHLGSDAEKDKKTLGALLLMSYDGLSDEASRRAFRAMTLMSVWTIDMLAHTLEIPPENAEKSVAKLFQASLIERRDDIEVTVWDNETKEWKTDTVIVWSMHPGVRAIGRTWLKKDEESKLMQKVMDFIIGVVRRNSDFNMLNAIDPYWPSIAEILENRETAERFKQGYVQLAAWLGSYFYLRGLWDYGLDKLRLAESWVENEKVRSNLLWWQAVLHRVRGELDEAMEHYKKSLEIYQRLYDQKGMATTYHEMAYIYRVRGELDEAMELYKKSLEIKERLGDQQGMAATYHQMAYIYRVRGELDEAMELYKKSLEIFERLGDQQGMAITLGMRGQLLVLIGDEKQKVQGLFELMRGFAMLEKLGAADAKNVLRDIKRFVTSLPSSTYRAALERLSDEERRIVEDALGRR